MDVIVPAQREASLIVEKVPAALGMKAARGAMWTISFSVFGKVVTLGGQILLAWFLLPEHFGLVAIALSLSNLVGIVCGANLKNLLVRLTQETFDAAVGQVFWLSLLLNFAGAAVLISLAPFISRVFHEPELVSLVVLAALVIPTQGLSTVYAATLIRRLQFRQIAMIHFGASIAQNSSAVLLAWMGLGASAMIWAFFIMAAVMTVSYYSIGERVKIGLPNPTAWFGLLSPVGWLTLHALFTSLQFYGSNFVIGMAYHDAAITGFYFWGFSVSSQAIFLLATNLQGVLFPTLSKLNSHPARQFDAMRRACLTLLVAVVPVCVLQYLLCGPLIQQFFSERWLPSVPVIQWLSMGLASQPLGLVAVALFLAKGEYKKLAILSGVMAGALMVSSVMGALMGDHVTIAKSTSMTFLLANSVAGWIAFRQCGRGVVEFLRTVAPPFLIGLLSVLLGKSIEPLLADFSSITQAIVTSAVCVLTYCALVIFSLPHVVHDLLVRIKSPIRGTFQGLKQ